LSLDPASIHMTDLTYGRLRVAGGFLGIVVATFYFFLAMFSFGGGHGTAVPFVLASPLPVGLFFFLVEGAMFPDLRRSGWRKAFVAVVISRFAFAGYYFSRLPDPMRELSEVVDIPTTSPIWALGLLLLWQIVIWSGFVVGLRSATQKARQDFQSA
jgi:hypothetical protein